MTHDLTRRQALGTMGAGAVALSALGATPSIANAASNSLLDDHDLGYDPNTNEYTLPDLPYPYDALAPHIDAQTMEIHHDKHHAGYVRGLNNALKQLAAIRDGSGDIALTQHWQRQLSFHAGGHINHTLFWSGMAPQSKGGGGQPAGRLNKDIRTSFGSYDAFTTHFKKAAATVEGSGWAWLVYEPIAQQLMVLQMENQQKMLFAGVTPLLGIDVWEHAYYLNYQNRRTDYIDAFMNVINWPEIAARYQRVRPLRAP